MLFEVASVFGCRQLKFSAGRRSTPKRTRGVTLMECLVTLAIVAILAALAAPSLSDQLNAVRARGAAHQIYAAIQYARSMAQRSGAEVAVCPFRLRGIRPTFVEAPLTDPLPSTRRRLADLNCSGSGTCRRRLLFAIGPAPTP